MKTDLAILQQRIMKEIQNIYREIQVSFESYSKELDQYQSIYQEIQETEHEHDGRYRGPNLNSREDEFLDLSENIVAERGSPERIAESHFGTMRRRLRTGEPSEGRRPLFRPFLAKDSPISSAAAQSIYSKTRTYSQADIDRIQTEAFMNGKQHIVQGINHTLQIFWEVWRSSPPFKNELMKTIYLALNKNRPTFLEEVVVTGLEQQGPPPKIFDVKHVTRLLSKDPEHELFVDFSYQIQGPIIVTGDTTVHIDWPKTYRIPVYMKAIVQSLCAKMRVKFNSRNNEENWIQWLGKPQAKISMEPIISGSFDLKHSLPRVKTLIDDFMQS